MSAAAMIINPPSWNRPADQDVRDSMRESAAFIAWRQNVEAFCSAMGCRCLLEHIDENRWLFWFHSGIDAQQAVLTELAEVAD